MEDFEYKIVFVTRSVGDDVKMLVVGVLMHRPRTDFSRKVALLPNFLDARWPCPNVATCSSTFLQDENNNIEKAFLFEAAPPSFSAQVDYP